MADRNRYTCTPLADGTEVCWDHDLEVFVPGTQVAGEIDADTAKLCDVAPNGEKEINTLDSESYYGDGTIIDLTVINYLGKGFPTVYTGTRDGVPQNTSIPVFANFATIEVQDVAIRYMTNGTTTNNNTQTRIANIDQLRDNGKIANSGDVITINSRADLKNFVFISNLPALATPLTAKVVTEYSSKPTR